MALVRSDRYWPIQLGVLLTLAGCAASSFTQHSDQRLNALAPSPAGEWEIVLTVRPSPLSPADITEVQGRISLLSGKPVADTQWPGLLDVRYIGVYNIDLETLGVVPLRRRDVAVAAAGAPEADVVRIVLNPGTDHGSLHMSGRIRGDSIVGQWSVPTYAGEIRGGFRMQMVKR